VFAFTDELEAWAEGRRVQGERPRARPLAANSLPWIALLAVALVTVGILGYRACSRSEAGAGSQRVRIAVHRPGTIAGVIATGLHDVLGEALPGVDVEVVPHEGQVSTMRGIDRGEVDLGFAFNLLAFHAVKTERLLGRRSDAITALTVAYANPAQIVVRRDSGLTAIGDLQGRRVSFGLDDAAGRFCSEILFSHFGIDDATDIVVESLDFAPSLEALLDGRLDAYPNWRGMPAPDLVKGFETGQLRLIPLDPESVHGLRVNHPFLVPWTIPARVYPHQEVPVTTVSARMLLVASRSLSADLVERILRAIGARLPDLIARHPAAAEIDLTKRPSVDEGLSIDLHAGAERFFESLSTPPAFAR
jgi:hypothetical protein